MAFPKTGNLIPLGEGGSILGNDYNDDLGEGKILGKLMATVVGINEKVGNTLVDLNADGTDNTPLPIVVESWNIKSNDVNDTNGGTGLNSLLLLAMDVNFDEEIPILILMNGTTDVAVPSTHLRSRSMTLVTAGSVRSNIGDVTLTVSSGGDTGKIRLIMQKKKGSTFSTIFTVPAGKFARVKQLSFSSAKNADIVLSPLLITPTGEITGIDASIYQSSFVTSLLTPFQIQEKTAFKIQAKRIDAGESFFSIVVETLLTDNPTV